MTSLAKALVAQLAASVIASVGFMRMPKGAPLSSIIFAVSAVLHFLSHTVAQPQQDLELRGMSKTATLHFATSVVAAVAIVLLVPSPRPEVVLAGPCLFGLSAALHHHLVKFAEPTLPRARTRKHSHRRAP